MNIQSELTEIFRKRQEQRRQHAVFFDFAEDRPGTELSVVWDWLSAG